MLRDGDFALEVTIFETGVPPQFQLYAYDDGEPLAAETVQARVELHRLDGQVDTFAFKPVEDYLVGDGTVIEPHSFDVKVSATHEGAQHQWEYASYEGRTTIRARSEEHTSELQSLMRISSAVFCLTKKKT